MLKFEIVGYQWRRYSMELGIDCEPEGWSEFWHFETSLDRCPTEDSRTQVRAVYAELLEVNK